MPSFLPPEVAAPCRWLQNRTCKALHRLQWSVVNPEVQLHRIPLAVQQDAYLGHFMEGGSINIFGQQGLQMLFIYLPQDKRTFLIHILIFSLLTWYLILSYSLGYHGILDLRPMKICELRAIKSFLEDQEPCPVRNPVMIRNQSETLAPVKQGPRHSKYFCHSFSQSGFIAFRNTYSFNDWQQQQE